MARFVDQSTLKRALEQLDGTAGPFFRVWLVLKQMGLTPTQSIEIDTSNSQDACARVFGYGDPENGFFYPCAATVRYKTALHHMPRSIVQTNIRQWLDGSGTKNPGSWLSVREADNSALLVVSTQRTYPVGLGTDESGFAVRDGTRVAIPEVAWAVWYGRQSPIPDDADPVRFLVDEMRAGLSLDLAERSNIFVDRRMQVSVQSQPIDDAELYELCTSDTSVVRRIEPIPDTLEQNRKRVTLTQTSTDGPAWLGQDPTQLVRALLDAGHRAILLAGPPRTGKTRAVRNLCGDDIHIIQIHDGWTYDQLIMGQEISEGSTRWKAGVLVYAIKELGREVVVLEEANRTRLSQALGEVFSLLEPAYRGPSNALTLPNESTFFIPEETQFFFTMNTIDKSTEDIDDALFGRIRVVNFPPRIEDLRQMFEATALTEDMRTGLAEFFAGVQAYYPLGHGYYVDVKQDEDVLPHYLTAVRPVLANHFQAYEPETLSKIDNLFDESVMR